MEAVLILLLVLLPVGVVVMLFRYFYKMIMEVEKDRKQHSAELKKSVEKLTNENLKKAQEEYEIENYGKITGEGVLSQLDFEAISEMIEMTIDTEGHLDKKNKHYQKALNIIVKLKKLKSEAEEDFDKVIKFELKNRHILKDYYDGKENTMEVNIIAEFKNLVIELNKTLSELKEVDIVETPLIYKVVK